MGDGVNDVFRLFTGPGVSNINYLQIYDRWGDMIYTQERIVPSFGGTDGWNGEYNNDLMNPGVYVYVAEVEFIEWYRIDISRRRYLGQIELPSYIYVCSAPFEIIQRRNVLSILGKA